MGGFTVRYITHVDEAEVVLVDGKLLGANLFLQSRGIGALQQHNSKNTEKKKTFFCSIHLS